MNIYLEDLAGGRAVKIDTTEPSGFTISSDPTIDWDKYSLHLVFSEMLTVEDIRIEIQIEHDTIAWASGSDAQRLVWAKWGVDTATNRAITIPDQDDRIAIIKEVFLLSNESIGLTEPQDKAELFEGEDSETIGINIKEVSRVIESDSFSSNVNNYAPQDLDKVDILRITTSKHIDFTGIVAPSPKYTKEILVINASNSKDIKVKHNSSKSTNINRVLCPSALDYTIKKHESAWFMYDTFDDRYRIISRK